MKKFRWLLPVLLAMFLSACQSSGTSTHVNVKLSDFALIPNETTVPAGSELTISVTNDGVVVHDFNIMSLGVDVGKEFDDQDQADVLWKINVRPNSTETAEFVAPEQPGVYQIVCAKPGHLQAGMVGKLVVVNQR